MKSATQHHVRWLDARDAAEYLGFKTMKQFYHFLSDSERPPRRYYLGNRLRFRQVDLDACVESVPEPNAVTLSLVGRRR